MFKVEKSIAVTEKDLEVVHSALDAFGQFCTSYESLGQKLEFICEGHPDSFQDDLCEDVIIHYVEEEETPKNAKAEISDEAEVAKWKDYFRKMCDHFEFCSECPFDGCCPLE